MKLELRTIDWASGMNCERRMPISVLGALSLALWLAISALGQSNAGELRLKVSDPAGLGVKSSVELASEANQYRQNFVTDDSGALAVNHLPFGIYRVSLEHAGFAPFSGSVEIRSAIPSRVRDQAGRSSAEYSSGREGRGDARRSPSYREHGAGRLPND